MQTELELQSARETIAARDRSIEKQKSSIREMQREREGFTNKLKVSVTLLLVISRAIVQSFHAWDFMLCLMPGAFPYSYSV